MTHVMKQPPSYDWMREAACRGMDLIIFFSDDDAKEAALAVREICGHCPVLDECLNWALKNKVTHGVWGGKTPLQRRRLLVRKPRIHCPGCESNLVQIEHRSEVCLSCGLTWLA